MDIFLKVGQFKIWYVKFERLSLICLLFLILRPKKDFMAEEIARALKTPISPIRVALGRLDYAEIVKKKGKKYSLNGEVRVLKVEDLPERDYRKMVYIAGDH